MENNKNNLRVNKDACIGCGACAAICPEVFEIQDDGLAEVIVKKIADEDMENAIDAKEGCPTEAIVDAKEGCPTEAIVDVKEENSNENLEN